LTDAHPYDREVWKRLPKQEQHDETL